MKELIDILIDGVKDGVRTFSGKIIAGILFAVALWLFPSLKKY